MVDFPAELARAVAIMMKLPFVIQSRILTILKKKHYEKGKVEGIEGNVENDGSLHFLFTSKLFSVKKKRVSVLTVTFLLSSANAFNFVVWSKIDI